MKQHSTKRYTPFWIEYVAPQRNKLALLLLLLVSTIGLQLWNPQILRDFIDEAQRGADVAMLLQTAGLFLAISFVTQVIYTATTYVGADVAWHATNALRSNLARHILNLEMAFHHAHTPGELLSTIDDDVRKLSHFFSQFSVRLAGNGLLLVGVLMLLYRETVYIGVAATCYTVATLIILLRLRHQNSTRWSAERTLNADFYGFLEERLVGFEDIRTSNAVAHVMGRYFEKVRALFRQRRVALTMNMVFSQTANLFMSLGYVGGLAIGVYAFQQGAITVGSIYLILFYISMLASPFREISRQFEDFQEASASIGRIQQLLQTQSGIADTGRLSLPTGSLRLQYQNVSFAYHADKQVLDSIHFTLPAGQTLGLLGRTGSGKTTLGRLLFRLYDLDDGHIRLGGVDIRDVPLGELRQRIGLVTQNVQLFHGTIRDNITFFDDQTPDAKLLDIISALGLDSWLQALPNGLDTQLLSDGSGLSAGEAQLLALARVFLKDPDLIIMDEASAHLDPATEQLLEQALDRLLANRTSIIIAHRLRTVQRADHILILENGKMVEHGPRSELLHNQASRFAQLVELGLKEALA